MSQINETLTVTATTAIEALRACIIMKQPVMFWGPAGAGKSDIVNQVTESLEGVTRDVRISQLDPTDLRGLPIPTQDAHGNTKTIFAAPNELPSAEFCVQHKLVVLFLDEMNSGAPAVQAAAYQLILNRRIGEYVLPDNVAIIAAGNRDGDKGVTYRMPGPLANRFTHLELRVDYDSWYAWALENDIHKDVVGYVTWAKQDLSNFDSKTSSRAFATPRTWSFVSKILKQAEASNLGDTALTALISGTVGDGTAVKFLAHRKFAGQLPNAMDILEGKVTKLECKEISAQYSLVIGTVYQLKELHKGGKVDSAQLHKYVSQFFEFCMDNFEAELVIMAAKAVLDRNTKMNLAVRNLVPSTYDRFQRGYAKYVVSVGN